MRLHAAREQTRATGSRAGGGDGLAKAVEIVLTPVIFAAAGFGLDRWLDTGPWLALSFGMVSFALKLMVEWYRYTELMNSHEADLAARRPTQQRGIDRVDETPAGLPSGVTLTDADDETDER